MSAGRNHAAEDVLGADEIQLGEPEFWLRPLEEREGAFALGAHLARREITVLFRELFGRIPDLEIVGEPEKPPASFFIHGIKRMHCSWTLPPR